MDSPKGGFARVKHYFGFLLHHWFLTLLFLLFVVPLLAMVLVPVRGFLTGLPVVGPLVAKLPGGGGGVSPTAGA